MFKRTPIFAYGVVSYAIFFATFLYALGFVGNFVVPRDHRRRAAHGVSCTALAHRPRPARPVRRAAQRDGAARFKRWWTRFVPEAAERSTYVLFSSVALIALFAFWQPLGGVVWHVEDPSGTALLYAALRLRLGAGARVHVPHQPLRPVRPAPGVAAAASASRTRTLKFGTPGPYKLVRHPLYLGWFFAFWATPTMTATHLLFAIATTAYILIAIQLEERDLVDALGEDYREYREARADDHPFPEGISTRFRFPRT